MLFRSERIDRSLHRGDLASVEAGVRSGARDPYSAALEILGDEDLMKRIVSGRGGAD